MDVEARITTFMAEYAWYIINRLDVEKDGNAAYEGVRGKAATVCICVGVKARSAELFLATESGVFKAQSLWRIPVEDNLHEGLHRGFQFPGLSRQPHSEDCRSRFAALMEKDFRYHNAQKRGMWTSTMRTTVSGEVGMVQRDERGREGVGGSDEEGGRGWRIGERK